MSLIAALIQTPWTREFPSQERLDAFADAAGFGPPEPHGSRNVRRHPDGVILHHVQDTDGRPVIAVIGTPESLTGPEGPLGLAHESPAERARRDIAVAYENVAAAAALLRIDLRADGFDGPEHGRRGKACGFLDMAAIHLGQNLDDESRSRRRERGTALGEAARPARIPAAS